MNQNFKLSREKTALLVVDVQEKLFPYVERSCDLMQALQKIVKGFKVLKLPIYATEQYPQGLGATVPVLKHCLGDDCQYFVKTTFSCMDDVQIKKNIINSSFTQFVVVGIEAHICVLQTAKDLHTLDKEVVVLNDGISSRSIFDYSTAIAELRDCGIRISSTETVLFELLRDSQASEFKEVSLLIK